MPLTHDSRMLTGKYAGDKMSQVPADFLLSIYEKGCSDLIKQYVIENFETLIVKYREKYGNGNYPFVERVIAKYNAGK